ncbi:MAG TPA: ester cyclase [Vicinamibacterales bacterium]|nr:ester cyclase [Vicinamibacterales bacterium]
MAGRTRAELEAIIETIRDAWQRRDVATLVSFHAPDGVVESPMYGTRRGHAEIDESYSAFFRSFPDAVMTVESMVVDPPNVAGFMTIGATHSAEFFGLPGTSRHIDMRVARFMRFDDAGLIVHERRIYDFTGVLVQVGVLRAKPAKP